MVEENWWVNQSKKISKFSKKMIEKNQKLQVTGRKKSYSQWLGEKTKRQMEIKK